MQLSIINYSHHAIHYIPRTFFFITGAFNFCSPPIPHLCQPTICICTDTAFCIYEFSFGVFLGKSLHVSEIILYYLSVRLISLVFYPCCCKCQDFLFVCLNNILFNLYIYIILFIHTSISGHLDCFHVFTVTNDVTVYMEVQISFQISVFCSFI